MTFLKKKKKHLFLLSIFVPLADVSKFHFTACPRNEAPPGNSITTKQQRHWLHGGLKGFAFRKAQGCEAKSERYREQMGCPHRSPQIASQHLACCLLFNSFSLETQCYSPTACKDENVLTRLQRAVTTYTLLEQLYLE